MDKIKYVKLPKIKTIRKRDKKFKFSMPLELNSLPKNLFDDLVDYIATAMQERMDKEQVIAKLKGESKEREVIQSIGIHNVAFTFTTQTNTNIRKGYRWGNITNR